MNLDFKSLPFNDSFENTITNPPKPLVSIIAPCRNEIDHIETFVKNVLAQEHSESWYFELIVADGMSDDGTWERLQDLRRLDSRIRVIRNPKQSTPAGLNAAINLSNGSIIARMDVHTEYEPDYLQKCLSTMESTGADNVGGPQRARSDSYFRAAVALCHHSRFGSGGGKSHAQNFTGWVDTVYLGCWRKETLVALGFFDEELVRNQDDELNLRLTRAGGRIWQSPEIKSWYYPRRKLSELYKQYQQYGYWKVRVIQKHRIPASVRHLVPAGFLSSLIVLSLLSFCNAFFLYLLSALLGIYILASIFSALAICLSKDNVKYFPIMPLIFGACHFGYGLGFLAGCIDFTLLKGKNADSFSDLSRGQPPHGMS